MSAIYNKRFTNRADAGRALADELRGYRGEDVLVLALPRGGVPVAIEIARALKAPLDTLVARKIGAPGNPEFGIGAIAPGDVVMLDEGAIETLQVSQEDIDCMLALERQEMERRMQKYHSGSYAGDERHEMIIVVDDGLATGITARAAIESIKMLYEPKHIVLAVPVCATQTGFDLKKEVNDVMCLMTPRLFQSVGQWYEQFPQVSDEEVVRLLETQPFALETHSLY